MRKLWSVAVAACFLFGGGMVAQGAEKPVLVPPTGCTYEVLSVAFSPDGETLASGNDADTVFLWDLATGAHKQTLKMDKCGVFSLAFSPNGRTLAAGTCGSIVLWDNALMELNAATNAPKRTLELGTNSVNSVAFNPNGTLLASGDSVGRVILLRAPTGG